MRIVFYSLTLIVCVIIFCIISGYKNMAQRNETLHIESVDIMVNNLPDDGKNAYMKYCLACHQMDGGGVPNRFPPLQKNKVVNGDKKYLIKILLLGLNGEIQVDDEIYDQVMPPVNYLSDKDISDVLSYVRKNFGNNSGVVKISEVSELRKILKK